MQTNKDPARYERTIRSLSEAAGVSRMIVRSLFTDEFARLHRDAKVRTYLDVLTASNVRAILRLAPQRSP